MASISRYTEIEHTADIGVEVYGDTLADLFANAGYALFNTIADADAIEPALTRTVAVQGDNLETLLMNWLRELLYLFSVEHEIYNTFRVRITNSGGVQDLSCLANSCLPKIKSCTLALETEIAGELLDFEKHRFETEIKAITYHQFAVIRHNNHWQATVVFDV